MKKFESPEQVVVVGRIMSVKNVNENDNGLFSGSVSIVTVEHFNEEGAKVKAVFNIGETMSNAFAKTHLLFEGNYVSFNVDKCIAGKTQYLPEGYDEPLYHTEDHDAVRDFFNASEEDVRNMLYPSTLEYAFLANQKVFKTLNLATIAQLSAQTADKAIDDAIARLNEKRTAHVITDAEKGSNGKITRKENLERQIADLKKRIETAPEALKKSLELRADRLQAELDAAA